MMFNQAPESIKLINKSRTCSYCQAKMLLTHIKTPRQVPVGAKDLGLTDSFIAFKCPQYGQTDRSGIVPCQRCGALVYEPKEDRAHFNEYSTVSPKCYKSDVKLLALYMLLEDGNPAFPDGHTPFKVMGCTKCTPCRTCKQALETYDLDCCTMANLEHGTIFMFHHGASHPCGARRREAAREQELRKKEQEARNLELQRQRTREQLERERLAAEQEKSRRIKHRLCLKCAKPLGMMDKMSGRQEHVTCPR
jgi:hypothetical protein